MFMENELNIAKLKKKFTNLCSLSVTYTWVHTIEIAGRLTIDLVCMSMLLKLDATNGINMMMRRFSVFDGSYLK